MLTSIRQAGIAFDRAHKMYNRTKGKGVTRTGDECNLSTTTKQHKQVAIVYLHGKASS